MAIQAVAVANSIANLTFSTGSYGTITSWDLDEISNEVFSRDCPLVMPAPTWFSMDELERISLGTGTSMEKDFRYSLQYRLFYKEAGQERNLGDVMPQLAAAVMAFFDGVLLNDTITGAVDLQPVGSPAFGVVEDPTGKMFWGADIELGVLEFI